MIVLRSLCPEPYPFTGFSGSWTWRSSAHTEIMIVRAIMARLKSALKKHGLQGMDSIWNFMFDLLLTQRKTKTWTLCRLLSYLTSMVWIYLVMRPSALSSTSTQQRPASLQRSGTFSQPVNLFKISIKNGNLRLLLGRMKNHLVSLMFGLLTTFGHGRMVSKANRFDCMRTSTPGRTLFCKPGTNFWFLGL